MDEEYAISRQAAEDVSREGSARVSDELIGELESADVLVMGTPMHNYTVPSALKLWIDHIAHVRRTFNVGPEGKTALLRDRQVFVAVASGGRFSGERARQSDFLTPYLATILGMIGLHDLTFFSIQEQLWPRSRSGGQEPDGSGAAGVFSRCTGDTRQHADG